MKAVVATLNSMSQFQSWVQAIVESFECNSSWNNAAQLVIFSIFCHPSSLPQISVLLVASMFHSRAVNRP